MNAVAWPHTGACSEGGIADPCGRTSMRRPGDAAPHGRVQRGGGTAPPASMSGTTMTEQVARPHAGMGMMGCRACSGGATLLASLRDVPGPRCGHGGAVRLDTDKICPIVLCPTVPVSCQGWTTRLAIYSLHLAPLDFFSWTR